MAFYSYATKLYNMVIISKFQQLHLSIIPDSNNGKSGLMFRIKAVNFSNLINLYDIIRSVKNHQVFK